MTDAALHVGAGPGTIAPRPKLDRPLDPRTAIILLLVLAGGLLYVAYSLYADVDASGARTTRFLPYLLLFVALLIARAFAGPTIKPSQISLTRPIVPHPRRPGAPAGLHFSY